MVKSSKPQPLPLSTILRNRIYRRTQLPTPYPDPEQWESNLKAALESDPRRKANYHKFLTAQRSTDVDYLPVRLDVELVSRCNYRCTMCQVSDWGPTYQRAGDMSLEDFKKLLDEQYGVMEIKLQGLGEPLLARQTYFDMIRYARSKHIWVRSTNNGSLLHFNDNYKRLIDAGINEAQLSIDGTTKQTFEKIRRGSNFKLVMDNCKLLNNYCKELGLLRTRMWTVVQRDNLAEFKDFVPLAQELGFPRVTFSLAMTDWGQERWAKANQETTVDDKITPELANEAIELGRRLNVGVTFWNSVTKYDFTTPDRVCRWPFQWAFISSDMRVAPCAIISNPDIHDLGDARRLTQTWNSAAYREFRKAHLEGRIPCVCRGCYQSLDHGVDGTGT